MLIKEIVVIKVEVYSKRDIIEIRENVLVDNY